jgi:hypothetical protein
MTTIERIDNFRRLWSVILRKSVQSVTSESQVQVTCIECPSDDQIYRWVSRFDDAVLEHGLNRLRVKILKREITQSDSAGRYLTAVLIAESQRRIVGEAVTR